MFNSAILGIGGILGGMIGGVWAETYGLAGMFRIFSIISAATVLLLIILFSIYKDDA